MKTIRSVKRRFTFDREYGEYLRRINARTRRDREERYPLHHRMHTEEQQRVATEQAGDLELEDHARI